MKKLILLLCLILLAGCTPRYDNDSTPNSTEEPSGTLEPGSNEDGAGEAEALEEPVLVSALTDAEKEEYYDTYLRDIYITGMLYAPWDTPEEIEPFQLTTYYKFTNLRESTNEIRVPAEEVEGFIQRHFDVPAEYIRQWEYYDPAGYSYFFSSSDGWGGGNVAVVDADMEGETLSLYYETMGGSIGCLIIDLSGDVFQYRSNSVNVR